MENASVYEILQLAIKIEEEGVKFYNNWASSATGRVKETFKKLAMDEMEHVYYFKGLYDNLKKNSEVNYLFEEEASAYFKDYAVSAAFNREQVKLNSVKDAVEEGILTEKKSIDYYEFLSKHAKESTKEMLGKIIKEEEQHLVILEKLLLEV
ncbi:ferritin family protein [Acetobacterium sp.]|uniref:ferritin-like domain-containing protein n=1 Tax=Acetobacterium sp. TaxID=1872094 RepID=UPI002F401419